MPTDAFRGLLARGAPMPLQTLLASTTWAVAAASAPPQTGAAVTIQTRDAQAAQQVQQIIVSWLSIGAASGAGVTPQMVQLLTPVARGDQVLLTLDDKQLIALATELKGPLEFQKQRALAVRSAGNIRQVLMACIMYSNDHKGQWPDDFKAMDNYFRGPQAKEVLTNSAKPDLKPAYVYLKPQLPLAEPYKVMVVYESHTDFGGGVNVGFADGHVEFVKNKNT